MRFRLILSPLLLTVPAVPALANETVDAPAPTAAALSRAPVEGEVLRDAKARIVGKVYKVQPSGGVLAIVNRETVRIPADTLSIVNGRLVTSLTKGEAIKRK